jgi:tetratricopeptide (TPR) repeat protein
MELSRKRGTPPEGYSKAFLEALSTVVGRQAPLAVERIAAPGRAAYLFDRSWEKRRHLVADDPRFRTWGLCERLIHESRQRIWSLHPDTLLEWARCALLVGEHLDAAHYGKTHVADLMAEVHSNLSNAHRLRSEFPAAHRHLDQARGYLAGGTGDGLEQVRLTSLEASLLTSLGHFERAVEVLDHAGARLRAYREDQLEAKLLVQKGTALSNYDPARGIETQHRALALLDTRLSPRLALCARQVLIWCLNASGRSEEALMLFQANRKLFRQFPDRWALLYLAWTEARISFDLGHLEEADAAYQRLWTDAFELDLRLETALISLDIIEIQIALGRHEEAVQVAGRLIDLFAAWGVHRRALQAWSLLITALRQHTASSHLVSELSRYLRRAWRNPEFEFSP